METYVFFFGLSGSKIMSQLMVIVKFLTIENKTSENNITNLKLSNADMTKKEVDTYLTSDLFHSCINTM